LRLSSLLSALGSLLLWAAPALAHDLRPSYLEIVEEPAGQLLVVLRQPTLEGRAPSLQPSVSGVSLSAAPAQRLGLDYIQRRWVAAPPPAALDGTDVRVHGLEGTFTEVLVHAVDREGRTFETVLRPDKPATEIKFGTRAAAMAAATYFPLGLEHILAGADHLALVLALVLLIGINKRLIWAVTAFTVGHSLTLAASVLGIVRAPVDTIEAVVALSILFVAAEVIRRNDRHTLTHRSPWVVALLFGLLHGFAFAGALTEIGLPERSIPTALLLFNLGVEAGQLLFIGTLVLLFTAGRGLRRHLPAKAEPITRGVVAYSIGGFAGFWFVERTVSALA
jgi:hydrogenase/urease accessory protein HupE